MSWFNSFQLLDLFELISLAFPLDLDFYMAGQRRYIDVYWHWWSLMYSLYFNTMLAPDAQWPTPLQSVLALCSPDSSSRKCPVALETDGKEYAFAKSTWSEVSDCDVLWHLRGVFQLLWCDVVSSFFNVSAVMADLSQCRTFWICIYNSSCWTKYFYIISYYCISYLYIYIIVSGFSSFQHLWHLWLTSSFTLQRWIQSQTWIVLMTGRRAHRRIKRTGQSSLKTWIWRCEDTSCWPEITWFGIPVVP